MLQVFFQNVRVFILIWVTLAAVALSSQSHADIQINKDLVESRGQPLVDGVIYFPEKNDKKIAVEEIISRFYQDEKAELASWMPAENFSTPLLSFEPAWFRLSFKDKIEKKLYIIVRDPLVHYIDFYRVDNGRIAQEYHTGGLRPVSSRPVNDSKIVIPLGSDIGADTVFYLRVEGRAGNFLTHSLILDEAALNKKIKTNTYGMWFSFGNLVLYALFSFGFYYATRELIYAAFAGYILSALCFFFSRSGYFAYILAPESPGAQLLLEMIGTTGLLAFSCLFVNIYLDLKKNSPILFVVNNVSCLVILIHIAMYIVIGHEIILPFSVLLVIGIGAVQIANWSRAIYLWKESKSDNAKYYAASWGVYYVSMFVVGLNELGITNNQVYSIYILQTGIGLLILILFVALVLHYKNMVERQHRLLIETEMRNNFLARVSHEIRTPMNGIFGMSQLLAQSSLNPEQKKYNDVVKKSAGNLMEMLNNLLDFSKMDAGLKHLEIRAFSPAQFFSELISIFCVQAEEKNIKLAFNDNGHLPGQLLGDEKALYQIMNNLLSNAIKFTQQGGVSCFASYDAERDYLTVEVTDTGIGLPEQDADSLFQAFVQADDSITREYGGTGLGLSIAKNLVEMMDGEIWVKPNMPHGAVIGFKVKLKAST